MLTPQARLATAIHAGLAHLPPRASRIAPVLLLLLAGCARHKIRAPQAATPTPVNVRRAEESGLASWYGDPYDGRRAASGEIFDKRKLTAAHRTLPFETWVEVTNLENGRSVAVRINDRGPFVEGRIIDLSQAAAGKIEMLNSGIARVRVRVIDPPADEMVAASRSMVPPSPNPPPPQAVLRQTSRATSTLAKPPAEFSETASQNPQTSSGSSTPPSAISNQVNLGEPRPLSYAVEAGAYPERAMAEARAAFLSQEIGDSRVLASHRDPQLWEVLVGRELTLQQAAALVNRLREKLGQGASVVLEPSRMEPVP